MSSSRRSAPPKRSGSLPMAGTFGPGRRSCLPRATGASGCSWAGAVRGKRAPGQSGSGRGSLRARGASDDEYARAAVYARNRISGGSGVADLAVPLLADSGQAEDWAFAALRRIAAQSESVTFALPPSRLAIEPGDTVSLSGDFLHIAETSGDGARHVTAYEPVAGGRTLAGSLPGLPGDGLRPPSKAELAVLDIPLFGGENERAGPLAAVHASPWYGVAAIHAGAGADGLSRRALCDLPAAIGETLQDLPPAPPGRVVDQSVDIFLARGTLESVSRLSMLGGANRLAIEKGDEWEIIQFRDAELSGDHVWTLSGLLRGQAGTDHAGPIVSGARCVLLDASLQALTVQDFEQGSALVFRAGPARRGHGDASYAQTTEVIERIDLRPLAPVHLTAVRTGAGFVVTWIRRTRWGGDSWSAGDVPLGEAEERYQVIAGPAGGSMQTFDVTEPQLTVSAADESALFGGEVDQLAVKVRQVSDRFGAGRAAAAIIEL